MRVLLAGMLLVATIACGKRQVNVETAPRTTAAVTLNFTNNDASAVNVYVVSGGSDVFLKQVAANSTEAMPVPGIAARFAASPQPGASIRGYCRRSPARSTSQ